MVDKSITLCKDTPGWFFATGTLWTRVKQSCREREHARVQANEAAVVWQEVGAAMTSHANSAMPHDPRFQPASHCSQRHWPGYLWPHAFSRADCFPPFPLHQQEHWFGEELVAQTALLPLPWCPWRGERHDTSKTRTRTRRVASAAGWHCRASPGTVTNPRHG